MLTRGAGTLSSMTSAPTTSARHRISDNLKRLRLERGLSQEKAAELADFHRTYVSQLERCVTNISIDGLERLALALGVDVVDLLQPADEQ
jgi:transcriptional regulator with XRE-family HTH domain